LSEGTDNGAGSWTVQTNNIAALSIISLDSYSGAMAAQCGGNLGQRRWQHRQRRRR